MVDLFHLIHSVPDYLSSHSLHDFSVNHIFPYIEDALDTVGDAAEQTDEMAETMKEAAKKNMDVAEGMVAKKTQQVAVVGSFLIVPVALLVGAFVIKILYDSFTKTADKVGEGVKSATSRIKKSLMENGDAEGNDAKKSASAGGSKSQKRRLLFGEIIKRFVAPSVTDADIEGAVTAQKEMKQAKKLGEIMVEKNIVSSADVLRALKIQEKSG